MKTETLGRDGSEIHFSTVVLSELSLQIVATDVSMQNSNPCHGPTSCLVSEGDDQPVTEVKQLLMLVGSDAARNFSWSHSYNTTEEELTSVVMENNQHPEL